MTVKARLRLILATHSDTSYPAGLERAIPSACSLFCKSILFCFVYKPVGPHAHERERGGEGEDWERAGTGNTQLITWDLVTSTKLLDWTPAVRSVSAAKFRLCGQSTCRKEEFEADSMVLQWQDLANLQRG